MILPSQHLLACRFRDAVQKTFAAQIELTVHERSGGAEGVVEAVEGEQGVFAIAFRRGAIRRGRGWWLSLNSCAQWS